MKCIKKKVAEELEAGNIRMNHSCPYHPSHFVGQNCTFCYCPFYPCEDPRFGHFIETGRPDKVWSCEECLFIHRHFLVEFALPKIKERRLQPDDHEGMMEIFHEAVEKLWRPGKAIMVVGATSDAGKSMTVAALGRIMLRKGYLCAPFKSQNMSLNSRVTAKGHEIAMVQMLQAQAMGLTTPDYHMNPILLKPKGNTESQVMVEGKPFGDYDVPGYYNDFVPGPGKEIVKRNVDYLKNRYDYVIMEGAGSPAEINIYDKDIANMRAAELADADCILVVNVEWGGSFAYAIGTVELLPPEDRKRIKGIILNNVRGDPEKMREGADELARRCGLPVMGIIPHADVQLPQEDSEAFRGVKTKGNGSMRIAVVKLPRIANFTDLDPLYTEDTTIVFADCPEDITTADAIVIPGTKNTVDDYKWLVSTGIADAIKSMKGKVPILGICGGYQMMGAEIRDPKGIEGKVPGNYKGLGLFNNISYFEEYDKRIIRDKAELVTGEGEVEGYEIHMGMSDVKEKPLFNITNFGRKGEVEGSFREDEMIYGTYIHGVLDKPAFRKKFLSLVKVRGEKPAEGMQTVDDYDKFVDQNLDKLADVFEKGLDMKAFMKIMGVEE
ncbi:MAG: cobyric acid synthase [archaeon]|nr:cobyric acid synthase [archaeon]